MAPVTKHNSLAFVTVLMSIACTVRRQQKHQVTVSLYGLRIAVWGAVLLEKLTGSQLGKKFPASYGNRRFITAFTRSSNVPILKHINPVHFSIPLLEDPF